jgi:hypothetical protein
MSAVDLTKLLKKLHMKRLWQFEKNASETTMKGF